LRKELNWGERERMSEKEIRVIYLHSNRHEKGGRESGSRALARVVVLDIELAKKQKEI